MRDESFTVDTAVLFLSFFFPTSYLKIQSSHKIVHELFHSSNIYI